VYYVQVVLCVQATVRTAVIDEFLEKIKVHPADVQSLEVQSSLVLLFHLYFVSLADSVMLSHS
jgi:hypothetical protein